MRSEEEIKEKLANLVALYRDTKFFIVECDCVALKSKINTLKWVLGEE